MPAHDFASTRFSPLEEIQPGNAARLELAFSFSTGVDKGHEAAPIVVDGTMYVVTPWPNYVYAFDLSRPGANVKWKFDPKTRASAQGVACCDVVNRGGHVFGGDGSSSIPSTTTRSPSMPRVGRNCGARTSAKINLGQTITMAPLVVKGKVLVGNSGGELGVRGWLTALEAATGKQHGARTARARTPMR
jgi:glucose dehydrogenase